MSSDQGASGARELFEQALAIAADQRARWLDAHCADPALRATVARLLAADAAPQLIDQGLDHLIARIGEPAPAPTAHGLIGQSIGPFVLREALGRGGSANVFRAEREQAGVVQQVALKLFDRALFDEDERRRFRHERMALAQLEHPHIARLIEGGVADNGLPYIALELVDGEAITAYSTREALAVRARLTLFVDVCRAVEAAHRALIVHRDIKPSNVFVTRAGEVKLLDFGIAKLLDIDDATQTGHRAMTPAYAAPEQFTGGRITTATDVYALGVLLGELLTGARITGDSLDTPGHIATRDERGELARKQLRGDLRNIVFKATAVEPEARYASAGALADDIARFLDGQPVAAHPPSRWYRARKFVRRHRGGVVATVLFLIAILASLGLAWHQARQAREQAARAEAVRDFLFDAFAGTLPSSPDATTPTLLEVVDTGIANARADRTMNPLARAELMTELGAVLAEQGEVERARAVLDEVYRDATARLGPDHDVTLEADLRLAYVETTAGDYAPARARLEDLLQRIPTDNQALRGKALGYAAHVSSRLLETARARAEAEQSVALCREACADDDLADALAALGNMLNASDDAAPAARAWEEALAIERKHYGERHLRVAQAMIGLSRPLRRLGEYERAEKMIRDAIAVDDAILAPNDHRRGTHYNALLVLLRERHDMVGAEQAAAQALAITQANYGDDQIDTARARGIVGFFKTYRGDYANARDALRQALDVFEHTLGPSHAETATQRQNYGYALALAGDRAGGEAQLRRAVVDYEQAETPNPQFQALALEKIAWLRLDAGDATQALELYERIVALTLPLGERAQPFQLRADLGRARAQLLLGDTNLADRALRRARAANAHIANADPDDAFEADIVEAALAIARADPPGAQTALARVRQRAARSPVPGARLLRLADATQARCETRFTTSHCR